MAHSFKVGDYVTAPRIIGTDVGKIETLFDPLNMAIVEVNNADGCIHFKIPIKELSLYEPAPEVTVNSAKFQEIAIKTIIEESNDDITLMLTFGIFVDKLRKALFENESND